MIRNWHIRINVLIAVNTSIQSQATVDGTQTELTIQKIQFKQCGMDDRSKRRYILYNLQCKLLIDRKIRYVWEHASIKSVIGLLLHADVSVTET